MQRVSQSDFVNWKSDPVTKAYFTAVIERIEDAKEVLSNQAGVDVNEDNYLRGFIRAYRECLEFRIEDLQEEVND